MTYKAMPFTCDVCRHRMEGPKADVKAAAKWRLCARCFIRLNPDKAQALDVKTLDKGWIISNGTGVIGGRK